MCTAPQTSHDPADPVRGGTAAERSQPPPPGRHRRPAYADPHYERKRAQRKARAHFAQAAARAAGVLEGRPPIQLSFPWEDGGRAPFQCHDPEGLQAGGGAGRDPQARDAAHAASQLRHGTPGSGSRSADDQPPAGTLELHHDDGLFARTAAALGLDAQSPGLAPGAAVSAVAGPESGWSSTGASNTPVNNNPPANSEPTPPPMPESGPAPASA